MHALKSVKCIRLWDRMMTPPFTYWQLSTVEFFVKDKSRKHSLTYTLSKSATNLKGQRNTESNMDIFI
jgi:hypothetical protein